MLRKRLMGVALACVAVASIALWSAAPVGAASLGGAAATVEVVGAPVATSEVPPNHVDDLSEELVDLLVFVLKRVAQRLLPLPPGGFWV